LPIVGERGCRAATAAGDARGDIAPAIVAGGVALCLAAGGRAGGAGRIEAGQLMGLTAVAVEVLVGASIFLFRYTYPFLLWLKASRTAISLATYIETGWIISVSLE
jgi:hypothetical protein